MYRRRVLQLSVAAVAATIAPTLLTQRAGAFVDKDCSDFRTQRGAQRFFNKQRRRTGIRDRHRLDGDGDGIACEDLP